MKSVVKIFSFNYILDFDLFIQFILFNFFHINPNLLFIIILQNKNNFFLERLNIAL